MMEDGYYSPSDIRKLISCVQQHDILYLPQETASKENIGTRSKIWSKIAEQSNFPCGDAAKYKFKCLRNSYSRYIRSAAGGKRTRPYAWATEMEFIKPYVLKGWENAKQSLISDNSCDSPSDYVDAENESLVYLDENGADIIVEEIIAEYETDSSETRVTVLDQHALEERQQKMMHDRKPSHSTQPVAKINKLEQLQPQAKTYTIDHEIDPPADGVNEFSPLELVFLGHAKVLQDLPDLIQVRVKQKLAEIMYKAELDAVDLAELENMRREESPDPDEVEHFLDMNS